MPVTGSNPIHSIGVCCDENPPCVPDIDGNSNQEKMMNVDTRSYNNNYVDSHKGENGHSKKIEEQEELKKHEEEQLILLKENKQNIIDLLSANKDSIRVEDLKINEPFYKCYCEKGNCIICNSLSNIICKNCDDNHKEIWLCINHWQQHTIDQHKKWIR